MIEIGKKAKEASVSLALADTEKKNRALLLAADTLERETEYLLRENAEDVRTASSTLSSAFIDRLTLTPARIRSMADGLRQVASLPDPVGRVLRDTTRADGLRIVKKAVPLGVIGVIFEARPNVSADSAALCIKSGNAVILRGGKEAIRSNTAAVSILRSALSKAGLPEDCVQLIQDTTRKSASDLMHLDGYIDVLIPRGGPGLINAVKKEATVPVIETGMGTAEKEASSELGFTTKMIEQTAEGRMGKPEELGFAIATIADQRNGYLAGVDVLVDGGSTNGEKFK